MNISPAKDGRREDARRQTPPDQRNKPARSRAPLVTVWISLMLLLAMTVGTSFISLGPGNALLNLGIAIAKALLVAAFFMHLAHAPAILRLIAIIGIVTLSLLFVLSGADYLNRSTVPGEWQRAVPSLQAGDG